MNDRYRVPAKLTPKLFPYIWGGTLLHEKLGKPLPRGDIGESWEVSAHPKGQSVLATGPAAGMELGAYAADPAFYGAAPAAKFPLLIKLLGADSHLSVQVHPSDSNCRPGEAGKAEAWYVIACEPGAELIYDVSCTKEEFADAVRNGSMREKLRHIAVNPGDVLDIPAGMVHALTAGVVIYEVQQNSDTTYRLYDWDRVDAATGKPRELHIDAALHVIEPRNGQGAVQGRAFAESGAVRTVFIHNPYYTLEKLDVDGAFIDEWFDSFAAYTVISGSGMAHKDGEECFTFGLGDSFIAPAAAGAVEITGKATILKSHVPPQEVYGAWLAGK